MHLSTLRTFDSLCIGILVTIFFLVAPFISYGQAMFTADTESSLQLDPSFPKPFAPVTILLDAYALDTTGAIISWYVDGVELPEFKNARSAVVQTGAVGKKQVVSATIKLIGTPAFTLRSVIVPTAVDIVVEASTYVPSFYRGRALPGADSPVRVVAIPHVGGADPRTLTYRWEQNGSILLGGPVRGKQAVELTMSRYYGGYVSVTVFDVEGNAIAQKNVAFDATSPELHFYEENPLRGLSERAIKESLTLIGDETTVHGEPYFMNTTIMSSITKYDWTINGEKTVSGSSDPHIITLRKTGGVGSANVGLRTINESGSLEYVTGNFSINF